jgi:hypothetical protein
VASTKFSESGTDALLLKSLEGRKIRLPSAAHHWPDPVHLAWHRANRLQGV